MSSAALASTCPRDAPAYMPSPSDGSSLAASSSRDISGSQPPSRPLKSAQRSRVAPHTTEMKARHSVANVCTVCGPIGHVGSDIPTSTSCQLGDAPSRPERIQARRCSASAASRSAVHSGRGAALPKKPRWRASAAR